MKRVSMIKKGVSALAITIALVSSSLKPINTGVTEIRRDNLFVPSRLGDVRVFHDNNGFVILRDGNIHEVQNCFVDREIRNVSNKELGYFLGNIKDVEVDGKIRTFYKLSYDQGKAIDENRDSLNIGSDQLIKVAGLSGYESYIEVSELSDGNYALHAKMRLPGGGPLIGVISYWVVKGVAHAGFGIANIMTGGSTVPAHIAVTAAIEAAAAAAAAIAGTIPLVP